MNVPDTIQAIGFTARRVPPGAETPEPCDEQHCAELAEAMPPAIHVRKTDSGCLLEWTPPVSLGELSTRPRDAIQAHLHVLLERARQTVVEALPVADGTKAAWTLATHEDGTIDAYARGRLAGSAQEVFLVIDPD